MVTYVQINFPKSQPIMREMVENVHRIVSEINGVELIPIHVFPEKKCIHVDL